MIPKIIHYCWLSEDPFPKSIEKCIDTWKKKLPEYEMKCWNTKNFDIHSVSYVEKAYSMRKWAFAADYIRLYALYTEGGIYLDSDVFVQQNFDDYLNYDFFTSVEYHPKIFKNENGASLMNENGELLDSSVCHVPGLGLQAAILGAIKGHPFLKSCMSFYENMDFTIPGDKESGLIAPDFLAKQAVVFGFRYKDEKQMLRDNMLIFPSTVFAGYPSYATEQTVAVHYCAGSWVETTRKQRLLAILRRTVVRTLRLLKIIKE